MLLQLGQNYVQQQQPDTGKGCYEWALLLSIGAGLLECTYPHSSDAQELPENKAFSCCRYPGQLIATRHLCQLYELECPDQGQCIKYNQHQIRLLRTMRAQRQEAEALESLSQRFLSLGAERWVNPPVTRTPLNTRTHQPPLNWTLWMLSGRTGRLWTTLRAVWVFSSTWAVKRRKPLAGCRLGGSTTYWGRPNWWTYMFRCGCIWSFFRELHSSPMI